MKKLMTHSFMPLLALIMTVIFTSCQFDDYEDWTDEQNPVPEKFPMTAEGGTLSFLDGSVKLSFPEGAIDHTEEFSVVICDNPEDCGFLLKMISIEPFVPFNAPVSMTVNFNGSLMKDQETFYDGICVNPVIWDTWDAFMYQMKGTSTQCCVDFDSKCIILCILQTGIFAFETKK